MNVGLLTRDQRHERWDSAEQTRLLLDWIAVVAQVLQVGSSICLDHSIGVVQEGDHFVQVGIAPPYT